MVSLCIPQLIALGLHELWLDSPSSSEPAQAADMEGTVRSDSQDCCSCCSIGGDSQEGSSCCSIYFP